MISSMDLLLPLAKVPNLDLRGLDGYLAPPDIGLLGIMAGTRANNRLVMAGGVERSIQGVVVSLLDSATRDRLTRWKGQQFGWPEEDTAPSWRRLVAGQPGQPPCWVISSNAHSVGFSSAIWSSSATVVPALGLIDLADPRADKLALLIVCRHIGEEILAGLRVVR